MLGRSACDSQGHKKDIALISSDTDEPVPPGAIPLTCADVYYIRKAQFKASSNPERWSIVYGCALGTIAVALSSFVIGVHARHAFQVYSQRYFWPTILPTVAIPTAFHYTSFERFITRPVLTSYPLTNKCNLCFETRGSVIQMTSGFIIPTGVSFLAQVLAALMERSYPIPAVYQPRAVWTLFKRFGRGLHSLGLLLLLGNAFIGSLLTYTMLEASTKALSRKTSETND